MQVNFEQSQLEALDDEISVDEHLLCELRLMLARSSAQGQPLPSAEFRIAEIERLLHQRHLDRQALIERIRTAETHRREAYSPSVE